MGKVYCKQAYFPQTPICPAGNAILKRTLCLKRSSQNGVGLRTI